MLHVKPIEILFVLYTGQAAKYYFIISKSILKTFTYLTSAKARVQLLVLTSISY